MELVAMRAFCNLIRVFRRVSKVVRWSLMARPLVMSAFAALFRDAATVLCSSAIILRRAARSSAIGSLWLSLTLESLLSLSIGASTISKAPESPFSCSYAFLTLLASSRELSISKSSSPSSRSSTILSPPSSTCPCLLSLLPVNA